MRPGEYRDEDIWAAVALPIIVLFVPMWIAVHQFLDKSRIAEDKMLVGEPLLGGLIQKGSRQPRLLPSFLITAGVCLVVAFVAAEAGGGV